MSNRFLDRFSIGRRSAVAAPAGRARAEAVQRLQIGISGLVVMVMLMTLADVIRDRADQTDASTVAEAAAAVEPIPVPSETVQSDPLVEAGVVPDLPAEPSPSPSQSPATVPEQGAGGAAR